MFPTRELNSLLARKQDLLVESAVRRQLLLNEASQIEHRLAWLDRGAGIAQRILPLCSLVIPLLSLWRQRKVRGRGSVLARIASALPIAPRLVKLWRDFQAERA